MSHKLRLAALVVLLVPGILMLSLLAWPTQLMQPGVVVGRSMRPTLAEGDLLVLRPVSPEELRVGDVVAYDPVWAGGESVVHRIVVIDNGPRGWRVQTKGDNNSTPDPRSWLAGSDVKRVMWSVPRIGQIFLYRTEVSWSLVLVGLGLLWSTKTGRKRDAQTP